jgi:hypothetical protein
MRDAFKQHHRLSDAEREQLWKTCSFALDANVLLNIYRYGDSTRDDLFKVLNGLKGRVWVPFQAAREFYRRRIDVIQEQRSKYTELEETLEHSLKALRSGGFKKSAFLKLDQVEAVLRPAIDQARQIVATQREEHPNLIHDDAFLERLVNTIGSHIGAEPEQATFDKRCTDAQARIDKLQPPGYRDAKKPVPERYGDVLIWYELLDHAEATKKPVIFVTDDDKEDWWHIVDGEKLGPRPELREEMRKRANVEFYIYNPAYLLETAGQQLNLTVAKSSVDDAAKVAAELQEYLRASGERPVPVSSFALRRERYPTFPAGHMHEFGRASEEAVYRYLTNRYSSAAVIRLERGAFDFLIDESSTRTAIEVKAFRQPSSAAVRVRVREAFVRAFYELSKGRADDYHLYVVGADEETSFRLADLLLGGPPPEPAYTTAVGLLTADGEYLEIGRESWARYREPDA